MDQQQAEQHAAELRDWYAKYASRRVYVWIERMPPGDWAVFASYDLRDMRRHGGR